ncbi:MAG: hypothetical protein JJ975_00605 [Bacteroidia bacterium]|nr:hypothetical protein [Bacteroidia bacterium]
MKTNNTITIILLLLTSTVWAQNKFERALASQGVSFLYQNVVSLDNGSSVAWIDKERLSYQQGDQVFKDSKGQIFQEMGLVENTNADMIIGMDQSGKPYWTKTIYQEEGKILGMVEGEENEIICVLLVHEQEVLDNWILMETNKTSQEKEVQTPIKSKSQVQVPYGTRLMPGINLVTLSSAGSVLKSIPVRNLTNLDEMDIEGCVFQPNGTIILNGFIKGNTLASNIEPPVFSGTGGGDFILAIAQTGIPLWGDIVHYRDPSCCTQTTEGSAVSVAPDGTVYFAGSYFNGGIFSNKLQTLTPRKYEIKPHDLAEMYVVSYTGKGKIRWIKTANAESRFHALSANNQGVVLGFYSQKKNLFGMKVDPTLDETHTTHLVKLNSNGNSEWLKSTQFQRIHQLKNLDGVKHACVSSYKLGFKEGKRIGQVEIPEEDDLVVFEIDANSYVLKYWSASLLLSREKIQLCQVDKRNNTFLIAFETWCGLPLDLNKVDSSLPSVKCYGGTTIIGEIKLLD